jgi:hypothetical protein
MNCPRCSEAVESGALYCGNCGLRLPEIVKAGSADVALTQAQSAVDIDAVPQYAIANPAKQRAENHTMLGLILSVLSVPGAIIPFLGAALAAGGLVVSTSSRAALAKKTMSNVAVGFAGLGIILSVGAYVYNLNQYNQQQAQSDQTDKAAMLANDDQTGGSLQSTMMLDTPCYYTSVPRASGINNPASSCTAQVFNAGTLNVSTNAYNLQAVTQKDLTESGLPTAGQKVADTYFASSLPGFTVTSQQAGKFAGSPAYYINARNSGDVTVEMAIVLRQVTHGENVFVLVHAVNGQADLSSIEQTWRWK